MDQVIVSEPEVGAIYEGTVVKTMEFGAFVNFFGARDGLVHISELAPQRVQKTTDVVKEGDKVKVKLVGLDDRGKVRLSMKMVDQETGEDISAKIKAERDAQGGDQGDRPSAASVRIAVATVASVARAASATTTEHRRLVTSLE